MTNKNYKNNLNSPYSNNDISKYRNMGRYSSATKSNKSTVGVSSFSRTSVNTNSKNSFRNFSKPENSNIEINKYSRRSNSQYSHKNIQSKRRANKRKKLIGALSVCAVLIVIAIGVYVCFPITTTVNGKEVTLTLNKTVGEAVKQSGATVNPGNYVAVDYSLLKKGAGHEHYVELNGEEISDLSMNVSNDSQISYQNGKDIMEDYKSDDSDIKAKASINGAGSLHKFSGDGQPGTWSVLTGKESGLVAERQTKDPGDVTVTNYNSNPESNKVIALTFDDGPSEKNTEDILDLLKKYNAKATFFVIGENVDLYPDIVAKEANAGHQVCTHTYDHARGYGSTDITNMPIEKRIQEVIKGQTSISKATGKNCSTVCRLPGGNIDTDTARLLAQYVTAEIGWNIDTGDWKMPGSEKILSNLKLASSGDVILCHDGGGDRSQTVAALKEFLPYATEKGYKFITIDEMLEYPAASQNGSGVQKSSGSTTPSTYTSG